MRFLSVLPMLLFVAFLSAQNNCHITGLTATVSPINPASCQYFVTLDFEHTGTTNQFKVQGNGNNYGNFTYTQLPVTLGPFTAGSSLTELEFVVIDLVFQDCSAGVLAIGPACSGTGGCEIVEMSVVTGDCNNATYFLTVDFDVVAPTQPDSFQVYANGNYFGTYGMNQLPLTIPNFPYNGGVNDVIKVCTDNALACCRTKEFPVPDCMGGGGPCEIIDLNVATGPCNNNTASLSYGLTVDFGVVSSTPVDSFLVYANGNYFGKYGINQLPLFIPDFPYNGGVNDVIKVCIANNAANGCCRTLEFPVPDCLPGPCEITQLVVDPGSCHNNGTYQLTVNFGLAPGTGVDSFLVFANGSFFGKFGLNQLPLTIQQFPWNGGATDVIKVCVANDQTECCKMLEFEVPDCLAGPCEVFNLVVDPGQCTSNTTYQLFVNFEVASPTDIDSFDVYANGAFFGTFAINQLPLMIPNFPYNGGDHDVIKVCIPNVLAECCRIKEFAVPDCLNGGPCEIIELVVDPGQCSSNTTYQLYVNFGVTGAGNVDSFLVWANGNFFGKYGMNQLPLTIPNFPYNGGANDVIKVCVASSNTDGCCRILEFAVPDCLNNEPCHIYDLTAVHTPCLCGQFFAVLTFEFDNVGSGGFDILGNGNNYGNFSYDQPQPIILGPLPGDGTNYEFVVRDHFHPDCHDAVEMGVVTCMVPVTDPGNTVLLNLSPNPAGDWLQVSAQLQGGLKAGQSHVEVFSADGRLVILQTVADGSNFQLNVSLLPAGMYRLVVKSEAGRVEGTFAKQ